jgi:hypothetical protein
MKRALALLVAVFLLLPAAAAQADDAGLWSVYSSEPPEVTAAVSTFEKEFKRFERTRGRRWRPLVSVSNRLAGLLTKGVIPQVEAQQPSSSTGGKVKQLVIRELQELSRGYRLVAAAARNAAKGRRAAISQGRRADRAFARAVSYDKRVVRGFKALGFERP